MCIICMFLVFFIIFDLFSSVYIFLRFTMFFPFLSTHSDAFLCCFWKYIHNMYMFRSTYYSLQKNLLLLLVGSASLWPEMPNFVQKRCYLFSFALQMKVFLGSQMTKPQPKWSIVWWIFHGFIGQKGLIPFWTIFYQNDHCGLGDLAFFNIIWCFTSQFA